MGRLNISTKINLQSWETMKIHAEEAYPKECCGFLFGADGETREIDLALAAPNNQEGNQTKRFEISPVDYIKAEKYSLENEMELLGIYHSHPDHPAIPSRHDFRQAVPFFSYIILSIRDGKLARLTSWQLNDQNKFEQEKVVVEKVQLERLI